MQNQPPYTPGGPLSTGHYEFTDEENQNISLTGARARLWGVVSMVTGVLALVGLVVSLVFKDKLILHGLDPSYVTIFVVSLVPIVLTHLVISMLYVGAGKSLQAIVATQGNDIEHLMQSLEKLGTAFLVEFAVGMLALVVSIGAGIQMATANVEAEKAADAARAEAENERLAEAAEADEDEDETDEGAEGAEDEDAEGAEEAEDEDAEDEEDGAAEGEEAGTDGEDVAEDAEDEEDVEDEGGSGEVAEGDDAQGAEDPAVAPAETAEEPVAG